MIPKYVLYAFLKMTNEKHAMQIQESTFRKHKLLQLNVSSFMKIISEKLKGGRAA